MYSLENYVKTYPLFDKDFCNKAIEELSNVDYDKGEYYNPTSKKTFSKKQEAEMTFEEFPSKKDIMDKLWYGIDKYIKELKVPYYEGWNGYSEIRVNKYEKGQNFNFHCDHIHNLFDGQRKGIPVLSIVGVLNDDYIGGEFIMWKDKIIKLNQGDVLIFPSNFLYPHKVNSIKKGTRYSFVSWVW